MKGFISVYRSFNIDICRHIGYYFFDSPINNIAVSKRATPVIIMYRCRIPHPTANRANSITHLHDDLMKITSKVEHFCEEET